MEQQKVIMMKRAFILCLCLIGLCCVLVLALADEGPEEAPLPEAVNALCQERYPGHVITDYSGFGNEQQGRWALVLTKEGNHVLVVAEKGKAGPAYRFTIENPTAIMPADSQPNVLIDTGGDVLFFSFSKDEYHWSFNATKSEDGWGEVALILYAHLPGSEQYYETPMFVREGQLFFERLETDGNDNILESYPYPPLPVPQLVGKIGLADFDWSAFPTRPADWVESYEQPNPDVLGALTPKGWTHKGAQMNLSGIYVLGQDEQGQTRLLLKRWLASPDDYQSGCYRDTVSAPLPENIRVQAQPLSRGVSLYQDSQNKAFSFFCDHDNVWPLSFVMAQDWYAANPYFLFHPSSPDTTYYFGTFPQSDIRAINLSGIPNTFEEAKQLLDQSGWAKVNNPNPKDRLHLRERPERGSTSLGKFYNGTPVKVLERRGDWARVRLATLEGWMMAKYLAFGKDMNQVQPAFPQLVGLESLENTPMPLYARPDVDSPVIARREIVYYVSRVWIIGVAGDEWFYVYYVDEDLGGYMKQAWFWEGNG